MTKLIINMFVRLDNWDKTIQKRYCQNHVKKIEIYVGSTN